MKLKKAMDTNERLTSWGINMRSCMVADHISYRVTPQATCVKKLLAQGYEEITWERPQWNAYYEASTQAGVFNYIGAGMKANIMKKDNEIVVIGRSHFQWTLQVIEI